MAPERGKRKVVEGTVVSARTPKTITVKVRHLRKHPKYGKYVRIDRRLHVHDEKGEAAAGDIVRVVECRPVSKTKRWRLVEIVKRPAMPPAVGEQQGEDITEAGV